MVPFFSPSNRLILLRRSSSNKEAVARCSSTVWIASAAAASIASSSLEVSHSKSPLPTSAPLSNSLFPQQEQISTGERKSCGLQKEIKQLQTLLFLQPPPTLPSIPILPGRSSGDSGASQQASKKVGEEI